MSRAIRSTAMGRMTGLALIDVAVAAGVLAIALLGITTMVRAGFRALEVAKETEVARLAALKVRGACAVERIRADSAADDREWLFRGGFEIARARDGASFAMPDVRGAATVTERGVAGAVVVEFPIPPLRPVAGRTHAGRLVLFVNETAMPAVIPTDAFPFPALPGAARLDCDGDGSFVTADLRQGRTDSARPCRLVPGRVTVEWTAADGTEARGDEWFIIGYPGHD